MELFFLAMLFLLMMYALGSGYPVAFALPGSAIITIVVASSGGTPRTSRAEGRGSAGAVAGAEVALSSVETNHFVSNTLEQWASPVNASSENALFPLQEGLLHCLLQLALTGAFLGCSSRSRPAEPQRFNLFDLVLSYSVVTLAVTSLY